MLGVNSEEAGLSRRDFLFGIAIAGAVAVPMLSEPARAAVSMLRSGLDPDLVEAESEVIPVGKRGGGGRGGHGRGGRGHGRGHGGGRGRGHGRGHGGGRGHGRSHSRHWRGGSRWHGRGGRWWGGRWYGWGGPCWIWRTPIGWVWTC